MYKPSGKLCFSAILLALSGPLYAAVTGNDESEQSAAIAQPGVAAASRNIVSLEEIWLAEHNKERLRLGLPQFSWDAKLAADAAKQASVMAASEVYEHADQSKAAEPQGENMWMGTAGAYDGVAMVDAWIDESAAFHAGTFPKVSHTGDWTDVGHYTQAIWPNTKRVGCAIAANARDEYMVCRYLPAGNVLGEKIGVK